MCYRIGSRSLRIFAQPKFQYRVSLVSQNRKWRDNSIAISYLSFFFQRYWRSSLFFAIINENVAQKGDKSGFWNYFCQFHFHFQFSFSSIRVETTRYERIEKKKIEKYQIKYPLFHNSRIYRFVFPSVSRRIPRIRICQQGSLLTDRDGKSMTEYIPFPIRLMVGEGLRYALADW